MGLSSKKTTTNSNSNFSQTSTPTNPSWVSNGAQTLGGQIMDLSKIDPQSLVGGPNGLQTSAGQMAGGLSANNGNFTQAGDMFRAAGNGGAAAYNPSLISAGEMPHMASGDIAGLISKFQSPYTNDVVNTSLADYDFGAGKTRAANQLSLAGDSTFGGSGGAIQTSMSNDAIDRGRGTLSAQLRDQGFQTALGGATSQAGLDQQANQVNTQNAFQRLTGNQNANNNAWQFNAGQQDNNLNRMLQAGQGLTGLGATQDANTRANATTQGLIGDDLRSIDQQQRNAGLNLLSTQTGLFGSLPLDLFHGQDTSGQQSSSSTSKTSDPMGSIGSLLGTAGSLMSGGLAGQGLSGLMGSGLSNLGLSGSMMGGQMLFGPGNSLSGLSGLGAGNRVSPIY